MWNGHPDAFATSVRRVIDSLGAVFAQLHAHLFDAPWDECTGGRCNGRA